MRRLLLILTLSVAATAGAAGQLFPQVRPLLGIGLTADPLFDDAVLHDIRLTLNDRDWQALKDQFRDNTYYPADLQWGSEVVRNIGIRSRGNSSRSGIKPGLRVDFNRYADDQRFRGLSSIVLRNSTTDASNMRERLAMLMFNRLGIPAPREAYARLFVNDEYAGLYVIVESVDKAFLRRTANEDEGHLFNFQYQDPFYFEYLGPNADAYVPLPFEPETHENNPQPEQVERLFFTINETSPVDFRTAMASYLDVAGFLRQVAVEACLADDDSLLGDAGVNNFYLYRFAKSTRFALIPWDKSQAFNDVALSVFRNVTDVPEDRRNRLIARALTYPDLYNLYLDTLMECVRAIDEPPPDSPDGGGWLTQEIERHYTMIRESVREDPLKPFTETEFEMAVDLLRTFALFRSTVVTDEVAFGRTRGAPSIRYRQRALPRSLKD